MKKILFVLAAGLMVSVIIIGCSTEEPWEPVGIRTLDLIMISAPDEGTTIPANSNVNFFWSAQNGSGVYTSYEWYLDPIESAYGDTSLETSVTYENLTSATDSTEYTFYVRVTDDAGNVAILERIFYITDSSNPTVTLTQRPADSSFAATGTILKFTWEGDDGFGNTDDVEYQYIYTPTNDTSDWMKATTVSFAGADDVPATTDAMFSIQARDQSGNLSVAESVIFTIKDASILYVDDYQWLDVLGNPDMPKERDQKQFYRNALEGYAFAEWDIALQGMVDSATVLNFTTILFASDSNVGDASGTWWYEIGSENGASLRYFMENGGHLLACGAEILYWIYNTNPPAAGDFEFDWFGIDSTDGWDYWDDFTWAINTGNLAGLPDSLKIDVAKNGDQIDYAEDIFAFRDSVVTLYVKGLDIDGAEPYDYGESIGHIFYPDGGEARSAMINFDTYSMAPDGIRQTFVAILTEFGE